MPRPWGGSISTISGAADARIVPCPVVRKARVDRHSTPAASLDDNVTETDACGGSPEAEIRTASSARDETGATARWTAASTIALLTGGLPRDGVSHRGRRRVAANVA